MCSVGYNPTFGVMGLTVEVNIFDFNEDIYGKDIRIEFVAFLRPEIKFSGVDELVNQLDLDKENSLNNLKDIHE